MTTDSQEPRKARLHAWTVEEVRRLLDVAGQQSGRLPSVAITWAAYWRAIVLVAWQAALRLDELLALRFDQVQADGTIVIDHGKTDTSRTCPLSPAAVEAVEAIRAPRRDNVFGVMPRWKVLAGFRSLVTKARLFGDFKAVRNSRRAAIANGQTLPPAIQ